MAAGWREDPGPGGSHHGLLGPRGMPDPNPFEGSQRLFMYKFVCCVSSRHLDTWSCDFSFSLYLSVCVQDLEWPGLAAGSLFQRPRANALIAIRGIESLDLPSNVSSYPLENVSTFFLSFINVFCIM